jgi:bacillolysin/neutral peptidase B
MTALERFHFHIGDESEEARAASLSGRRSEVPPDVDVEPSFASDEAAARFHLSRILAGDSRPGVRGIAATERAARVPHLRVVDSQQLPGTSTKLLRFEQTQDSIPIFGAHAVCELTEQRGLVSASGRVGKVEGVSSFPSISQEEARSSIARFAGVDADALSDIAPAELNFFQDDQQAWHLVWFFRDIPAAPREFIENISGHGLGRSPRIRHPLIDFLVDAHTAEVVYFYSATALLSLPLPVPVRGAGFSEDGRKETVWGRMAGMEFELYDALRDIQTHDLEGGDIDQATLGSPYRAPSSDLGADRKAVVSAHVNAARIYDFFDSVLQRDSIDNAGMKLINVVNCTSPADEPPPTWHNAQWWGNRMWFGQAVADDGTLISFARFLDITAHELTHGVTKFTSDLLYRDQSGALNESFSDIFGILVKNWEANDPDGGDVTNWDWEFGAGLGANGLPLRDMSDPTRTGDPAHMNDYHVTAQDEGGVHTNSNIHNKAAYNVLTTIDDQGQRLFTPREVALLYYNALIRLGRFDGFGETLIILVDVASSMYAGELAVRDAKVAAIRAAYGATGII